MNPSDNRHEVHLGAQDRLVIPARVRRAPELKPGDALALPVLTANRARSQLDLDVDVRMTR